jgi:hypothetical protein
VYLLPTRASVVLTVFGVTLLLVAPATAQREGASGTSRRLSATSRSNSSNQGNLDLTVVLSEALDSEVPPDLRSTVPQDGPRAGGYSTTVMGSAAYANTFGRTQIAGTALTAFRYYDRLDRLDAVSHSGGIGANMRLPRRATLRIDQTVAYSPSYLFQLFPDATDPALGDPAPAAPDYGIERSDSYSSRTSTTYALGSARAGLVSVSADYGHTDFQQAITVRPHLTIFAASGRYSHAIARNGTVSVEYRYHTSEFGDGASTRQHAITIGATYSKPLTARRRATFRFDVAPSALRIPAAGVNDGAIVSGQAYRVDGKASVDYGFHGTWHVSGNFRRSVEYVAVLGEPVFSDAAGTELAGSVTNRVNVSASAGYMSGGSALAAGSGSFDTYTGHARVRFAATRSLGVYSEYLYYQYDLRTQSRIAPDLPRQFNQNGIRFGLMVLVSAF